MGIGTGYQASVLRQELLRISQQGTDMIPYGAFQLVTLDLCPRTGNGTGSVDAILAGAAVVAPRTTG